MPHRTLKGLMCTSAILATSSINSWLTFQREEVKKVSHFLLGLQEDNFFIHGILISAAYIFLAKYSSCSFSHCGLVTSYGNIDLGQDWEWLVAWQHQAISQTNVDLSTLRSSDIHLRAGSQEIITQPSITKIRLKKMTYLKMNSKSLGANELMDVNSNKQPKTLVPWPIQIFKWWYMYCLIFSYFRNTILNKGEINLGQYHVFWSPVPQVTRTSADMVLAMLCGKELAFLEGRFDQHLTNPFLKNDTDSWTYLSSILFQTCLPYNLKKCFIYCKSCIEFKKIMAIDLTLL